MWNMTSCWIWQVVEIWQAVEHQAPLIGHYACSVASFKLSSEIVDSSYTLLSLSHPHWCTDSPWSSMFMLLSALLWPAKSLSCLTRSFKPVYSNEEPRLLQLERTLHIHRLTPKRANPNGPCSTLLERIPPDTPISEVLYTVSRRMGFEASALWMDAAEGAPRVRVGALDQLRSETLYVSEHTSARDALKLDL